ncbi:ABC transporter ATP-binding protein [Blastococcus sp. TBT05-19]|uniref:ABC transporter ATP-binding protein n=1 Tax=Blastococcus sp. TBT05-19 TaxID=2250581 RepID=UPI001F3CC5E7|nr:ABC transporter ATP-binding protein [Blastococcus sp. TBT05-19]
MDRRGTSAAALLTVLGAFSSLGLVLASHLALTTVLVERAPVTALALPLALLAVTTAVSAAVPVLLSLQQRVLGERVMQDIWRRLLDACASADLVTYESHAFLNRLERVRSNALSRPAAVVSGLLGLGGSAIGVIAMGGALVAIAPLMLPVLLLGGIPTILLARRTSALEFGFARRVTVLAQRRGYLKLLLSHRATAAELRAFDATRELLRRHAQEDDRYLGMLTGHVVTRRRYALAGLLASALTLGGALAVVVWLTAAGRLSLPDAGAAAIAARILGGQLSTVFRSFGSLMEASPFLVDLAEFHQDYPPGRSIGQRHDLSAALLVEDVSFSYPGQERPALEGVSVVVPKGQVVALVGENGSGKTTLAKIMAGLYEPDSGHLLWDGTELKGDDRRASSSVLFQDFLRYQMSVVDNVAISDTSVPLDRARVEGTVARIGITDAVERLPHGFDTVLGIELEEGADLSGGQWQRLALARALYRDRSLVVLDEPSAALDPRAEHELFADVRGVLDGRAAVLISHRYSSVRLADLIYVMHAGRVVERGTHQELMAAGGRYAELYVLQAEAYMTPESSP